MLIPIKRGIVVTNLRPRALFLIIPSRNKLKAVTSGIALHEGVHYFKIKEHAIKMGNETIL